MGEQNSVFFSEPAKWEQNFLCHSPGHLQLSKTTLEFIPHRTMSLLGKHLIIPVDTVESIKFGDNFFWRGVVNIILSQPINDRSKYIFFLGSKRKNLVENFEMLRKGSE